MLLYSILHRVMISGLLTPLFNSPIVSYFVSPRFINTVALHILAWECIYNSYGCGWVLLSPGIPSSGYYSKLYILSSVMVRALDVGLHTVSRYYQSIGLRQYRIYRIALMLHDTPTNTFLLHLVEKCDIFSFLVPLSAKNKTYNRAPPVHIS